MHDTTIRLLDIPNGDRRERIVSLANRAKHALFAGGSPPIPDDVLLRAAMAVDNIAHVPPGRGGHSLAEVAVVLVATSFVETIDDERNELTKQALASTLCDPAAELAAAVENNRRLLEGTGEQ